MSYMSSPISFKDEQRSCWKEQKECKYFVYFQLCPECEEPIIGVKEAVKGEIYMNPNDTEGLLLLKKERKRA